MEPVPRCSFSTWQPCCRNPHRTQGRCCCTQMTLASVGPRPFTITLQLPALLLLLWPTDPTVINHCLHKAQPAPAPSHWSDDHPTVQKKWGNQTLSSSVASSPHPSPAPTHTCTHHSLCPICLSGRGTILPVQECSGVWIPPVPVTSCVT